MTTAATDAARVNGEDLLTATGVSKAYGGARALEDVSLTLRAGEVHALMGENGAGKSTLIKVLAGIVAPDAGEVRLSGRALRLGDPHGAEEAGVITVHQEAATFPSLSVVDNLFLGREPRRAGGLLLDRARMRREAADLLAQVGLEKVAPDAPLSGLPLAARQMVAVARALARGGRVLILDEPTASLSHREADALFAIVRRLRDEGRAILYVSHRMDEIFALSDRVTVLRDGRYVETCPLSEVTRDSLIRRMVGRDIASLTGAKEESGSDEKAPAETVLNVRGLCRTGAFEDISFTLRAGEIVGMGGLVGAGRSEVARAIFGADRPTGGEIRIGGASVPQGDIRAAIARGIALVPEDRQALGLVLPLSVHDNLALVVLRDLARGGWVRSKGREKDAVQKQRDDLAVRAASTALPAAALSGGNQQKLVLGKWLAAAPRVLILDEPTRGVDVGAKAEIYRLIRELARSGMATLLISSDLPELLSMSDRVLVMRGGQLAGELGPNEMSEERVLALAFGEGRTPAPVVAEEAPV